MTHHQKMIGWLGLALLCLGMLLHGLDVKSSEEFNLLLSFGCIACLLLCLAWYLNSRGKDGFSVFLFPAVALLGWLFRDVAHLVVAISLILMAFAGIYGGLWLANEASKRAREKPVLCFCAIVLLWYTGVIHIALEMQRGIE